MFNKRVPKIIQKLGTRVSGFMFTFVAPCLLKACFPSVAYSSFTWQICLVPYLHSLDSSQSLVLYNHAKINDTWTMKLLHSYCHPSSSLSGQTVHTILNTVSTMCVWERYPLLIDFWLHPSHYIFALYNSKSYLYKMIFLKLSRIRRPSFAVWVGYWML